jgi:hypothetical protein
MHATFDPTGLHPGRRVRVAYREPNPHVGVRGVVLSVGPDDVVVRSDKSGAEVSVPFANIAEVSSVTGATAVEGQIAAAPFRPSATRAKWAMVLVGVTTGSVVLEALVILQGLGLFEDIASKTEFEVQLWQKSLEAMSNFFVLAMVASGIAFLAWLSRAVDNVPALGGGNPIHSPGAAIGWWFVPFVNLIAPYQIVADLWRRMATSPAGRSVAIILAWWLLWVGGAVVERALGVGVDSVATVDGFIALLAIMTVALIAQVIAGALLIRIVWQIEEWVRIRAVGSAPVVVPSPSTSDSSPFGLTVAEPVKAYASSWLPNAAGPTADARKLADSVSYCPKCGHARIASMRFCAACGTDLVTMSPQA